MTRWLFTASDEASDVRVSEPQGQFVVNLEGSGPIVFVAGGIGVTPALPTLRAAIAKGASRVVHIDWPIRVDDAPDLRALISGLVDALPRASLKVRVDGDGHPLDGAAIEAIVRAHKGATFYLCFKPELEAHGGSAAQACWSSPAHSGSSPSRGSPGVSRRRYEPYLCTVWSVYLPRRCSSCTPGTSATACSPSCPRSSSPAIEEVLRMVAAEHIARSDLPLGFFLGSPMAISKANSFQGQQAERFEVVALDRPPAADPDIGPKGRGGRP